MRRRTAQGLTIAFLVSLGAAQGPNSSGSSKYRAVPHNVTEVANSAASGKARIPAKPYQIGTASWYGHDFEGKPTASGEPYNMYDLTAAHPTLPLGTYVKVTNLRNRRAVVVRINDRGPVVEGRIIDVSYSAAKVLKFHTRGVQRVRLDIVPAGNAPLMAMLQRPKMVP
jgi:rare lipoprotein A (peptidoglycan hydrolase)